MKLKSKILLMIAAVALLCLVGLSSKAQRASRTRWEYKLVTVYGFPEVVQPSLQQFNDLGAEGWELVTMRSENLVHGDPRQAKLVYYFKRQA